MIEEVSGKTEKIGESIQIVKVSDKNLEKFDVSSSNLSSTLIQIYIDEISSKASKLILLEV